MRLKRNRLKTCSHKQAIPQKDNEGNSYLEYGRPSTFEAEVWPAGGKLQMEMYGQRVNNIKNIRIDGTYEALSVTEGGRVYEVYRFTDMEVREGDGICLHVPGNRDPDYKIIAIRPYRFLTLEAEKI